MIIRTAAVLLALSVIAGAQAPTQPPPKPKVISMPKKPKSKPKPKPKPAVETAELPELPPAADPATEVTPVVRPTVPEPSKRNRGAETSLAAYMPKMKATLGKTWTTSVQQRAAEFQPGNVSMKFTLDAEGKVTAIAITENSSNAAFGKFCEEYVRGLQFDPPPPRNLVDGALEIPFTFWLY